MLVVEGILYCIRSANEQSTHPAWRVLVLKNSYNIICVTVTILFHTWPLQNFLCFEEFSELLILGLAVCLGFSLLIWSGLKQEANEAGYGQFVLAT